MNRVSVNHDMSIAEISFPVGNIKNPQFCFPELVDSISSSDNKTIVNIKPGFFDGKMYVTLFYDE